MNKTNDFKYNLPAYSDPVDIEDLNDNFRGIDDALMAGLCKKDYTGNNMGSSDPSARKYAWAPWLEIVNDNEFDVVVTDRNAPVGSEEATINIAAGQTFRKYINGRYYMNFYVQDQHDVTFKWFTNAETYINESGGGGGGTGTVTSVSVQGGSGSHLTGSGNPIETSGIITINVDEGYSIPSDNEQTAWDEKAADLKFEINSSTFVITAQLKDSSGNLIGNERTIDLPLETMVVDGEYDPQTKKIKLELKNGNYVEFSVADLVSGLQTELSASNKLDPAYIDYDSSHRAVSDTEKDTWSGKQNAISDLETIRSGATAGATAVQPSAMQTALAGKQDSLDQTQLAAVNSGIDSAKVAQISTNQSNILYAINTGVKNLIVISELTSSYHGVTINRTPKGVTISGTADADFSLALTGTVLDSGGQDPKLYSLFSKLPNSVKLTGAPDSQQKNRIIIALYNDATWVYSFSSLSDMPQDLSSYTYNRWYAYIPIANGTSYSGTWYPMLQDASISDDTFVPGALPNYDLTRLESEDRASLAEVVDSGAKNLLDFASVALTQQHPDSGGNVPVYTKTNTSFTISGTVAWVRCVYGPIRLKAGTYVLYTNITAASISSHFAVVRLSENADNTGQITRVEFTTTGKYSSEFTISQERNVYISFCPNYNDAAIPTANSFTATDLMICTKAAFGVSKAFVPYRPNYDLVSQTVAHDLVFKKTSETITTANTWQVYSSLAVTLPVGKTIDITAAAEWSHNSPASDIAIIKGATVTGTQIIATNTAPAGGQLSLCAHGMYYNGTNNDATINIAVKYPATENNQVSIAYRIF